MRDIKFTASFFGILVQIRQYYILLISNLLFIKFKFYLFSR